MNTAKSELRKELLRWRKALDKEKILQISNKIAEKVFLLDEFVNASQVFCYVSLPLEISTYGIIQHCFKIGKRLAVPVCIGEKMEFRYIDSLSDLELGSFSVMEPKAICKTAVSDEKTICITPALCYNTEKFRIGYGKGYYDRFFSENRCIKIGLCCEEFICDFKQDANDIAVDLVVTEKCVR